MRWTRACSKWLLIGLSALATAAPAPAQDRYPSRPVKIVVTFGAGGVGDLLARAVASQLTDILGTSVVVENRAGGNAVPGTEYVAKSPADGYTILQYTSTLAVNQALQPNLPYDLQRDFAPLSYSFEAPLLMLVASTAPYKTVPELLAYAKTRPEGISYGHGGSGSLGHLTGELFKRANGLNAVSVPYKGNGPAMGDLIGGRLDYYFATVADSVANVKGGKLTALAVTSPQRDTTLPEVPTLVELGFKDMTPQVSWGFMVPKATPTPIVKQLSDAFAKAIAAPVFQEKLSALGATSRNAGGPDLLAAKIKAEQARWEPVIKAAGIKP